MLPSAAQSSCGPGLDFQQNNEGFIVWVGQGNTVNDGITKNLWQARLPFEFAVLCADSRRQGWLLQPVGGAR